MEHHHHKETHRVIEPRWFFSLLGAARPGRYSPRTENQRKIIAFMSFFVGECEIGG